MYILFNGNRSSFLTNYIELVPYQDWLIIKNNNQRLNSDNKKDLAIAYFHTYNTNIIYQPFTICNKGEDIYIDYVYYWNKNRKINISHIKELDPYTFIEINIELYHPELWDIKDIPEYFIVFTIY